MRAPNLTCDAVACLTQMRVCAAQSLLEAADNVDPDYQIGRYVIPPQSPEGRVVLARAAVDQAREALIRAGLELRAMSGADPGASCSTGFLGQYTDMASPTVVSNAEAIANAFTEAYWLLRETTERAFEVYVAAADAEKGKAPTIEEGRRIALRHPELSRGAFAELLLGFSSSAAPLSDVALALWPGTPGARAEDSPPARRALRLLREGALDPRDIADFENVDLDALIVGGGGLRGQPLRDRIEAFRGDAFVDASGNPMDANEFLESLGLLRSDLVEARQYVREELWAFDRVRDHWLAGSSLNWSSSAQGVDLLSARLIRPPEENPPEPDPLLTEAWRRFAATGTEPYVPPGDYYATLASGVPNPNVANGFTSAWVQDPSTQADYARHGVAYAVDWAHTLAHWLSFAAPDVVATLDAPDAARRAVLPLVSVGSQERPARIISDYVAGQLVIKVHTDAPLDAHQFFLVRGTPGLECATTGLVAGEPCDLAVFDAVRSPGSAASMPVSSGTADIASGFGRTISFAAPINTLSLGLNVVPTSEMFYVVHRATAEQPWEMLGAVLANPGLSTDERVVARPVVPWASELAGRALTPSKLWLAEPGSDCAGLPADQRIPLENSLSENGDGVEDSWRTYLALASQAASEADLLGDRLIDQGLEMDRRSEAATEELEQACGVSLPVVNDATVGASCAGLGEPPPGGVGTGCDNCGDLVLVERNGRCIQAGPSEVDQLLSRTAGPDASSEERRLAQCLGLEVDGQPTVVPFASFAERPMCLWATTSDGSRPCDAAGVVGEHACPFPAGGSVEEPTCALVGSSGASLAGGFELVASYPMGLFSSESMDEVGGNPDAETDFGHVATGIPGLHDAACRTLRDFRNAVERDLDPTAATNSGQRLLNNVWGPVAFQDRVSRIAFQARAGDFSRFELDGVVFDTGSLQDGPGDDSVCAASGRSDARTWFSCRNDDMVSAHDAPGSLFCRSIDCTDHEQRRVWNNRVGEAALLARLLGGGDLEDFVFPWRGTGMSGRENYELFSFQEQHGGTSRPAWADPRFGDPPQPLYTYTASLRGMSFVQVWGTTDLNPPGQQALWWAPRGTGSGEEGGLLRLVTFADGTPSAGQFLALKALWRGFSSYPGAPPELVAVDDPANGGLGSPPEPYRTPIIAEVLTDPFEYERVWSDGELHPYMPYFGNGTDQLRRRVLLRSHIPRQTLFDALEILCEVNSPLPPPVAAPTDGGCGEPPDAADTDQMEAYVRFLECTAGAAETRARRTTFARVPRLVAESLSTDGTSGSAYPNAGGTYASALSDVRAGLQGLATAPRDLASAVRDASEALRTAESELRIAGLQDRVQALNATARRLSAATTCASAAINGVRLDPEAVRSSANAALQCGSAMAQLRISNRIADLNDEIGDVQQRLSLQSLMGRIADAEDAIYNVESRIRIASERLNAGLAQLEQIRLRAGRALARATFMDQDQTGRTFQVNTVMRRRLNTNADRYRRAHRYAVQMTQLARIALEQRLGTKLDRLGPMSLIEDPADWVNDICTASGIDYNRIRDASDEEVESFAGEYVGDYVARLEAVRESYRLDFPFTDGNDVSVVSMRDEIFGVRVACEPEDGLIGYNILRDSQHMLAESWKVIDCDELVVDADDDGTDDTSGPCIRVRPLGEVPPGNLSVNPLGEAPRAFRVFMGSYASAGTDTAPNAIDPAEHSLRWEAAGPQSRLAQTLELRSGVRYRLSWWARGVVPAGGGAILTTATPYQGPTPVPQDMFELRDAAGVNLASPAVAAATVPLTADWQRFSLDLDLTSSAGVEIPIEVALRPRTDGGSPVHQVVDVAGVQLERLQPSSPPIDGIDASAGALAYDATYGPFSSGVEMCEDTEGERFREQWTRRCERFCAEGATTCPVSRSRERCFWEASFDVEQVAVQLGEQLDRGFARGNFNYRIDGIGLNLVGTSIRDCSNVPTPSTCYADGSLSYELEHLGPFRVRGYSGYDDYEAPLFDGRIRGARALAAERYLTNPLSSADSALLSPFIHQGLRGRPLDGRYRVKIWEDAGVDFSRVEDVQVYLSYRYWTALDR
ncbi:MAG: hypothetical protein AAF447_04730 [Myxococcota bacterium]